MMRQFNLRMPPDLFEEVKRLARQHERSVAGELRALIKEKLAESKHERKGVYYDTERNTTPARGRQA